MKETKSEKTSVVSKDELIHQVAAKAGVNLNETNKVIDAFTQVVRDDIARGQEVRLMGFGTWKLRPIAERKVTSIRGGTTMTLPAHQRVGFSVGAVLAQAAEGKTKATARSKESKATPPHTGKK